MKYYELEETINFKPNSFGEFGKTIKETQGDLSVTFNLDFKSTRYADWEDWELETMDIDILKVKYKGEIIEDYCEDTLVNSIENCLNWK